MTECVTCWNMCLVVQTDTNQNGRMTSSAKSATVKLRGTREDRLDSVQSHLETKPVCISKEAGFNEIIPEATAAYNHVITPSGVIEKIFPNTSRCPLLNAVDCEEEDKYWADDRECGQDITSSGAREERTGDSHTPVKNISRTKEDAFQEQDGAYGQDISYKETIDVSTGDSHTQIQYTYRREEDAVQKDDGACDQVITPTGASDECTDDSHTQIKRINSSEEITLQGYDGACGQDKASAQASEEYTGDSHTHVIYVSRREEDSVQEHDGACGQDGNNFTTNDNEDEELKGQLHQEENADRAKEVSGFGTHSDESDRTHNDDDETTELQAQLPEEDIANRSITTFREIDTHSECERSRSKMESLFAQRCFDLEEELSDVIQISRQQLRLEMEQYITFIRISRLSDCKGHEFGAIYKAMPDSRRRFTVQLVQKYAWLKEEMPLSTAQNVAHICFPARYLEYLHLKCNARPQYVGYFLKMVLRCGKQRIENTFLNALQTEGTEGIRFASEVEHSLVSGEKMKAFEDLQRERNQYHISEDNLPNVCCHSYEVDLLNDHLFSRLLFSYKEHSDIEELNGCKGKISLFFDTFRKCQENVFDDFRSICDANGIFIGGNAQRDDSTITDVIIDEPSIPPSLQSIGIETIHTHEGSLVMILKLTEENSLTHLKDKCEDGSIGDVLIDLLQRKDVRARLEPGTYDFKMTLHATTEDAHFVEMKIEGTVFDQKEPMCKHQTGDDYNVHRFHQRYICEELEISNHLLNILRKKRLVPPEITSKLRVIVNRRDKIHELLRHYDTSKDEGFGKLSEHIKTVRESREKKAYQLKLFEGSFVAKFDGSCFRIVQIELSVTCASFAGKLESQNEATPATAHFVYCDDCSSARQLFKHVAKSGLYVQATEITHKMESDLDPDIIMIPCSSCQGHWQSIANYRSRCFAQAEVHSNKNEVQRYSIYEGTYPFSVAVIHDDESKGDKIDEWMNKNIAMPYKVHHVNLSDMNNQNLLQHFDNERETSMRFKERSKTIIIHHLKGSFEYENKFYREVVNLGLGCSIVSETASVDMFSIPCLVIHKGVDLNNERLRHHTGNVYEVLLIDMDNIALENLHTMMEGLMYRMHDIDLENIRCPQDLLERLTGIQKKEDGTTYKVCISFDNCNAKHADIVYKGLENIGLRCIYRSNAAHEKGFRHEYCLRLKKIPSEYIDFFPVCIAVSQQLKVLVNDTTSEGVIKPLEARTISISLEDTEWPEKVKAKLEGMSLQSIKKPTYYESALTDKLAISRSGYRSKIEETKHSSADIAD